MKQPKSDIPHEAIEVVVADYRQEGLHVYFKTTECILNGQVVGQRGYDADGRLMIETPLKNGRKHGREFIWDFITGDLESVEPYVDGKLHGLAKQYGRNGKVIGTYYFVHGTGYDIWRCENEDGSTTISEIHSLQDGAPHGCEWWLRSDQHSLWHERRWYKGTFHGIERMWNARGRLKRGYPKYWIENQAVNKRVYLKAAAQDKTLPEYREIDDRPQRSFPAEIEKLLSQ